MDLDDGFTSHVWKQFPLFSLLCYGVKLGRDTMDAALINSFKEESQLLFRTSGVFCFPLPVVHGERCHL